jgi:hypothetical protein
VYFELCTFFGRVSQQQFRADRLISFPTTWTTLDPVLIQPTFSGIAYESHNRMHREFPTAYLFHCLVQRTYQRILTVYLFYWSFGNSHWVGLPYASENFRPYIFLTRLREISNELHILRKTCRIGKMFANFRKLLSLTLYMCIRIHFFGKLHFRKNVGQFPKTPIFNVVHVYKDTLFRKTPFSEKCWSVSENSYL